MKAEDVWYSCKWLTFGVAVCFLIVGLIGFNSLNKQATRLRNENAILTIAVLDLQGAMKFANRTDSIMIENEKIFDTQIEILELRIGLLEEGCSGENREDSISLGSLNGYVSTESGTRAKLTRVASRR